MTMFIVIAVTLPFGNHQAAQPATGSGPARGAEVGTPKAEAVAHIHAGHFGRKKGVGQFFCFPTTAMSRDDGQAGADQSNGPALASGVECVCRLPGCKSGTGTSPCESSDDRGGRASSGPSRPAGCA